MTLFVSALIASAFIGSTVAAFVGGTVVGKRLQKTPEKLIEERDEWIKTAREYKAIAETHTVEFKKKKRPGWEVVEEFQYDSSIEDNFKRFERDLNALKHDRVRITTRVYIIGEWSEWLAGKRSIYTGDDKFYTRAPNWAFRDSTNWDEFGKLNQVFVGTTDDVTTEFKKFISNPQWGFWVGGAGKDGKKWGWARTAACIRFKVKVEVPAKAQEKPEVVYVKVAVKEPDDRLRKEAEREVELLLRNRAIKERSKVL